LAAYCHGVGDFMWLGIENYTKTIFVTDWMWNDATEHGWEIMNDLPAEIIEILHQIFNKPNVSNRATLLYVPS
jgi:hypothetical protein